MIARLSGRLLARSDTTVTLDVHGVGYLVFTNAHRTPGAVGDNGEFSVWTYLAVRENALELFGFSEQDELAFFTQLIGVSGVGPRTALAILATAPLSTLKNAIASGDTSYLTKVSGIGKKNAQKIVVELEDKLESVARAPSSAEDTDVLEALVALGYGMVDARHAVNALGPELVGTHIRITTALRYLGTQ